MMLLFVLPLLTTIGGDGVKLVVNDVDAPVKVKLLLKLPVQDEEDKYSRELEKLTFCDGAV